MPQKVLFTASTYTHIRHFHLPYLQRFQQLDWKVHVACADAPDVVPGADEVIPLPFQKKMSSPENFRAAALLRRKIREEGYDLVITHTSLAAFFTRMAVLGMKERPPVVNMAHGYLFDDDTGFLKKKVLMAAERLTAPVTDLLLTMNRWDYETAQKYSLGKRVGYVPGIGVDFSRMNRLEREECGALRRECGISEDAFVLIYAAEFSVRKSQSVLIRSMTELPEHVVLLLPGRGVLLTQCMELARDLGVENRVVFPGYVNDMPRWYGMADAAVSASRSEGLPFNIMEAMYLGLPVVASAVKGHTDLIEDGTTGLLYPYGDSTACAAAIRELLEDADMTAQLTRKAYDSVQQYGLEPVLPAVMNQYESVLPKTPAYAGK